MKKVVIGSEYAARGVFEATSRLRPDYVRTAHAQEIASRTLPFNPKLVPHVSGVS